MLSANAYNDLCTTCNYFSLCTRRANIKRPIFFCEEFDNTTPQKKSLFHNPGSNPGEKNTKKNAVTLKGLCSNCENREHCMFPKPEEGVWHCEEYL